MVLSHGTQLKAQATELLKDHNSAKIHYKSDYAQRVWTKATTTVTHSSSSCFWASAVRFSGSNPKLLDTDFQVFFCQLES